METDSKMTLTLGLVDKNFKAAINNYAQRHNEKYGCNQ